MAQELVGDHCLHKESQQNEGDHQREGDEVELLEILQQVVVVVTRYGLHDDAA